VSSKIVALVAGVIVLSACATPDADPGVPLKGSEIKRLLDNAQIKGTGWDGALYVAHHTANGRVAASWGDADNRATGTWRVEGDVVCVAWDKQFQNTWASGCWAVEETQKGTERFIEMQGPKPGEVSVSDAVIHPE
jgi:hypothetical protein